MLCLQMIHQLILPHEAIRALVTTITDGTVEVLGADLMAFGVAIELTLAAEGCRAARLRARAVDH